MSVQLTQRKGKAEPRTHRLQRVAQWQKGGVLHCRPVHRQPLTVNEHVLSASTTRPPTSERDNRLACLLVLRMGSEFTPGLHREHVVVLVLLLRR